MTTKLTNVLDAIQDFADTDPYRTDWEIISDLVEQYLDALSFRYADEDYLPEDDSDFSDERY